MTSGSLLRLPPWLLVSVGICVGTTNHAVANFTEDELKAAFVYNFAKFVDWSHLPASKEKLVVGVVGSKPLRGELYRLAGKRVGNREIEVVAVDEKVLSRCDLVFVGRQIPKDNALAKRCLGMMRLLTVSDREGFVADGGGIELYRLDKRIRYDVRHENLAKKGLKVSSKLLSMAVPRKKSAED